MTMRFGQTRDSLYAKRRTRAAAAGKIRRAQRVQRARFKRRVAQQPEPRSTDVWPSIFWPSSLARALLGLRAMAAVDVSRVVELTNKAATHRSREHWARASEIYAEAVAAAQALHQPDCLIVADLQATHAAALFMHAQTVGVPKARCSELIRFALLELLPPAMASLERRLAAGTLLAGACQPYEMAWCASTAAHADALVLAKRPNAGARPAAELAACSAYVGYDAYMCAAGVALKHCEVFSARLLSLPEATTAIACSVFVESAFRMLKLRTTKPSMSELMFVRNAQIVIEEQQCFHGASSGGDEWRARILAAWRRLQSSDVLQQRGILQGVSFAVATQAHAAAAVAATAAAYYGLRVCALDTCGAQEVHASHFKRCSACLSVVY
jgi:hypothetical protein